MLFLLLFALSPCAKRVGSLRIGVRPLKSSGTNSLSFENFHQFGIRGAGEYLAFYVQGGLLLLAVVLPRHPLSRRAVVVDVDVVVDNSHLLQEFAGVFRGRAPVGSINFY